MKVQPDALVMILFILHLPSVSEGRSPRRNRNRAKQRNGETPGADAAEDGTCALQVTCPQGQKFPVSLPIKGPKLPREKTGNAGERGSSKKRDAGDGVTDQDTKKQQQQHRAAFFAGLHNNVGPVSKNTDLAFDKIITNVGEAFSGESGRFTAPVNGTYVFSVTIAAQGRQRAAVELSLNGRMVATIWAESIPYWASASTTAILNMRKGDQAWLILLSRASHLHGYMYSTFSGHCLYWGV